MESGGLPSVNESILHVWILDLNLDRESLASLEELLSVEEWRRVRLYSTCRLGRRFIARRGLLRLVLGQYLNQDPKDISFLYNAYGKPFLAPELSTDLQFSLSDSGDKAALAVGLGQPVGVDIERLRSIWLDGGLEIYSSLRREIAQGGFPEEYSIGFEFFKAWTRHEAVAKAEGVGLQMQSSQPGLNGGADYAPAASGGDKTLRVRGYYLHSLTLPSGYVGTLAARTRSPRIVYCSWERVQHALTSPYGATRAFPGHPLT
ncbi:MAG: hypothetical protein F4Z82_08885 [Caldilineaceae bacterium SB0668_bin_21]|nr:hypothetical protein [Caldilineaceae bacterium SB0668_bin_21]MYC20236.1 hypothetical protein [Caldilineaceae bacterium SB0662_bin_25]